MTDPIRIALERLVELDDAASCVADRYTTAWVDAIAAARDVLAAMNPNRHQEGQGND